ncbi:MAG TPA: IS256 family transposase [Brevefilum fermentans]|mgnify:FL=1|jgi:transposase-like protein|uniref:Mutator family transposase n=1 Tax=Candidatus Brevifilum fermentans TaxID=1986204 RepID=A0A1Y6K2H0_9CHLR|nr:IS256 family transposase [Brevefilum fermentans]SMX53756.1 transposase [Brevefilum fermentans]HOM68098.1 IS256 family transposase [Brevefilum fermentans]
MTHQENYNLSTSMIEELAQNGLEVIPELVRVILNNVMQAERSQYLQAKAYERTEDRQGHANGYKPKTVRTRLGDITFAIPQVREGGFYPSALEKGMRSERALLIALAEMYVQGVSTRRVKAITEELMGVEISAMQVSRAAQQLDEVLQEWRERPLGEIQYLYADARYEKVRDAGQVRDAAVLVATGISPEGERQVLGVSVSLSEHETHWKAFLKSLKDRGMHGVKLVISDDHAGLGAARRAVFGSVPWQRCQFHLQQNAGAYVPRQSMRKEVAADIRAMFNAPDKMTAEQYLKVIIEKYARSAPRLSVWMEHNLAEGFTVFDFPLEHRRSIRTTNSLERINKEIRRRTRVVGVFPNEASCLRLISARLMEISEDWQIGKRYCAARSFVC